MYIFVAHYVDMNTDSTNERKMELNGQFFDSEKEIYLYAMSEAFDMTGENEILLCLEFIAC